jgi:hypothetical protein
MYQSQGAHYGRADQTIKSSAYGRCFAKRLCLVVLLLTVVALYPRETAATTLSTPSQSTTIALTSNDRRLVIVNREANSLTILRVRNAEGRDINVKVAEIAVGLEPRCVALIPSRIQKMTNAAGEAGFIRLCSELSLSSFDRNLVSVRITGRPTSRTASAAPSRL